MNFCPTFAQLCPIFRQIYIQIYEWNGHKSSLSETSLIILISKGKCLPRCLEISDTVTDCITVSASESAQIIYADSDADATKEVSGNEWAEDWVRLVFPSSFCFG